MLNLNFSKPAYNPGETISGELTWDFDQLVKSIDLRLTWIRRGVSEPEAMVVQTRQIPCNALTGRSAIQFTAPAAPYSFVGALFAIEWLVEASTSPVTTTANFTLFIAPNATPVIMLPPAIQTKA
jgi:hypothetical protein